LSSLKGQTRRCRTIAVEKRLSESQVVPYRARTLLTSSNCSGQRRTRRSPAHPRAMASIARRGHFFVASPNIPHACSLRTATVEVRFASSSVDPDPSSRESPGQARIGSIASTSSGVSKRLEDVADETAANSIHRRSSSATAEVSAIPACQKSLDSRLSQPNQQSQSSHPQYPATLSTALTRASTASFTWRRRIGNRFAVIRRV
jgi:hypothetical protein